MADAKASIPLSRGSAGKLTLTIFGCGITVPPVMTKGTGGWAAGYDVPASSGTAESGSPAASPTGASIAEASLGVDASPIASREASSGCADESVGVDASSPAAAEPPPPQPSTTP